jgi:hypothetical protein
MVAATVTMHCAVMPQLCQQPTLQVTAAVHITNGAAQPDDRYRWCAACCYLESTISLNPFFDITQCSTG